jgi:hypothetical protein
MKEIGGYLNFSSQKGNSNPHKGALALNTARNSFEYVLLAKTVKKVFIPYYTCEVMLEPLIRQKVDYKYYSVDQFLDPVLDDVEEDSFILYTNYFGIKNSTVLKLAGRFKNLIVDNSQAFYASPLPDVDTFYSARKFFGVPDGAYLYTSKLLVDMVLEQDVSYDRIIHLAKRIETGANESYETFLENDLKLYNQPIRQMSAFTKEVMQSQSYGEFRSIRERNFLFLHHFLKDTNQFKFAVEDLYGPMFYPFVFEQKDLKQELVSHHIYVPTLWRNVYQTTNAGSMEQYFADHLCALPIDQRYDLDDMKYIVKLIQGFVRPMAIKLEQTKYSEV